MAFTKRLAALGAARKYAQRNSAQVHGAIDKLAGLARDRAPQQHRGKVDSASEFVKKAVTGRGSSEVTSSRSTGRRARTSSRR